MRCSVKWHSIPVTRLTSVLSKWASKWTNQEQTFHLDWTNNLSSLIHSPSLVSWRRSCIVPMTTTTMMEMEMEMKMKMMIRFTQCTHSHCERDHLTMFLVWTKEMAKPTHSLTIYIVCRKVRNYSFFLSRSTMVQDKYMLTHTHTWISTRWI